MATTSHNMVDGIFTWQNDAFLLRCQVAQSSEYSKAKSLALRKALFTLVFAILSIVSSLLNKEWLSAISSFLAVALALYNKHSDKEIGETKKHASSLQRYIDASLFAQATDTSIDEWGNVPTQTDLAVSISQYETKDTSRFVDWYSDYSSMNGNAQVFYCQKENLRWDYTLHCKFRLFLICSLCVVSLAAVTAFLVVNPSFVKAFYVASWLLPIVEYACSAIKEVNKSISILQEADLSSNRIEKKINSNNPKNLKNDLIKLQHQINKRRECGCLIPDWFYRLYKRKQQEKEDSIAQTIQELKK